MDPMLIQSPVKIRYICEYCDKEFMNISNLNSHRKVHLPKTDFPCPHCEYASNYKNALQRHIRIHTKERPYKCPHPNCESAFSQQGPLNYHLKVVHNKEDESALKFKCTIGPNKTLVRDNPKIRGTVHSEVKTFSCNLCPYKAKQKWYIKQHVQRVHWKAKPFLCPHPGCQYSCKVKYDLTPHMNVHSNAKPFVCSVPQCEFKAKCKAYLNRHVKSHDRKYLDRCTAHNFLAKNRNDHEMISRHQINSRTEETSDPGQSRTRATDGQGKIWDNGTNPVTHVQWSVDWGKIQSQYMKSLETQPPPFSKSVIKIEHDTMEPFFS